MTMTTFGFMMASSDAVPKAPCVEFGDILTWLSVLFFFLIEFFVWFLGHVMFF